MYNKLRGFDLSKSVRLIDVKLTSLCHLSKYFIDYDTAYWVDGQKKNYLLKDGQYLMLYFMDNKGLLFTTLRRQTPEKTEHYMGLIGCDFELIIERVI